MSKNTTSKKTTTKTTTSKKPTMKKTEVKSTDALSEKDMREEDPAPVTKTVKPAKGGAVLQSSDPTKPNKTMPLSRFIEELIFSTEKTNAEIYEDCIKAGYDMANKKHYPSWYRARIRRNGEAQTHQ